MNRNTSSLTKLEQEKLLDVLAIFGGTKVYQHQGGNCYECICAIDSFPRDKTIYGPHSRDRAAIVRGSSIFFICSNHLKFYLREGYTIEFDFRKEKL